MDDQQNITKPKTKTPLTVSSCGVLYSRNKPGSEGAITLLQTVLLELVHSVVGTTGFQRSITCEEFLVVITDVRSSHILVLNSSDALTDLFTLYAFNVGQHAFSTEVAFGQVVGRQSRSVVSRQSDQVVEYTRFTCSVALEVSSPLVSQLAQLSVVVFCAHQLGAVVSRYILAFFLHGVEHLLTEVQSPVERWAVVVNQLGIGNNFLDAVYHGSDLTNVRLLSLDPQHVCTVLQASDAVQNNTIFTRTFFELEQARSQTLGLQQLAVRLDYNVAVLDLGSIFDVLAIDEAVVLVTQVTRLVGYSDLLGQASTQRVGTSNDNTVIHTQLKERQAYSVDLGQEVGVRNGYFTVLVSTLLLVRNLVFDLDAASTRFDHLLGQQVSCFVVTETSVDVSNDRYNVSFVVVDLLDQLSSLGAVASFFSSFQITEQVVQFPCISLTQEGV